jgi:hypothetical protein
MPTMSPSLIPVSLTPRKRDEGCRQGKFMLHGADATITHSGKPRVGHPKGIRLWLQNVLVSLCCFEVIQDCVGTFLVRHLIRNLQAVEVRHGNLEPVKKHKFS